MCQTKDSRDLAEPLLGKYEVRQREFDGSWCIYLREYNMVIATFSKGCYTAAMEFKAFLESA